MFSSRSPKQPDNVLSHWYVLLDGPQFSTTEFYDSIERALAERRVPRLRKKRVEYHEGGRLSDKRLYLRLARERFSFEVCASPFGTGYFFSLRFVEIPRGGWVMLLGILLGLWVGGFCFSKLVAYMMFEAAGWFWIASGFAALAVMLGSAVVETRNAAIRAPENAQGIPSEPSAMPDFDSFLLSLPVLGAWYEMFRKDTFYRHDNRLMYHTLVSEVVKKLVDELTAAKGVKLLRTHDYNPFVTDFYKVANVKPGVSEEPRSPPDALP